MSEKFIKVAASLGVSPETVDGAVKGGARASPGLVVILWEKMSAVPIDKWVQAAVLVFTLLQIVVLVRKEFFKRKGGRK